MGVAKGAMRQRTANQRIFIINVIDDVAKSLQP